MEARDVRVEFDGSVILRGVDISAPPGGWLGVIGPNGAGKTTLLRALAGLVAYEGTVTVRGSDQRDDPRCRARTVAYVPQDPVIPPGLGVVDYVMLGRAPHQRFGFAATSTDEGIVTSVLARLGLAGLASRRLDTLSGGERQRVVVARALAQEAPVLLLDEPTSSLDVGHQVEVLEMVDELRRERGLTVVATLHDLNLAAQFAERLVLVVEGQVVARGTVDDVVVESTLRRWFGANVSVAGSGRDVTVIVRRGERPVGPVTDRHHSRLRG